MWSAPQLPSPAFTAYAAALSVPLWLVVLFANNLMLVVIVNIVLYGLALMWVGPATLGW